MKFPSWFVIVLVPSEKENRKVRHSCPILGEVPCPAASARNANPRLFQGINFCSCWAWLLHLPVLAGEKAVQRLVQQEILMVITLKYGHGSRDVEIPSKAEVTELLPNALPELKDLDGALGEALDRPLHRPGLEQLISERAPRSVAIAVPDATRPTPVKSLLPSIVRRILAKAPHQMPKNVTIVIGGGLHPASSPEDMTEILEPDMASEFRVMSHDANKSATVDYGYTSRGTPVRINAEFAKADLKIVIGQSDPHQFVGFTGGSKGVVVGIASAASIEGNHSLMFEEQARVGKLSGNPVREDMNEAGRMVGIDLAVNVVLDADNRVVSLLAGEPDSVLEAAAATCAAVYGVEIHEKFDMVIASCGGHPKDICLYQAQKGLNLASSALLPRGKILLLAACHQGVGDDTYLDYVSRFSTPQQVLEDFKRLGFKMGAHKAYLFARTLDRFEVAIASELPQTILNRCQLRAAFLPETIEKWVSGFPGRPRVAVVPNANTTFFITGTE
jgi:lactate racemase